MGIYEIYDTIIDKALEMLNEEIEEYPLIMGENPVSLLFEQVFAVAKALDKNNEDLALKIALDGLNTCALLEHKTLPLQQ